MVRYGGKCQMPKYRLTHRRSSSVMDDRTVSYYLAEISAGSPTPTDAGLAVIPGTGVAFTVIVSVAYGDGEVLDPLPNEARLVHFIWKRKPDLSNTRGLIFFSFCVFQIPRLEGRDLICFLFFFRTRGTGYVIIFVTMIHE